MLRRSAASSSAPSSVTTSGSTPTLPHLHVAYTNLYNLELCTWQNELALAQTIKETKARLYLERVWTVRFEFMEIMGDWSKVNQTLKVKLSKTVQMLRRLNELNTTPPDGGSRHLRNCNGPHPDIDATAGSNLGECGCKSHVVHDELMVQTGSDAMNDEQPSNGNEPWRNWSWHSSSSRPLLMKGGGVMRSEGVVLGRTGADHLGTPPALGRMASKSAPYPPRPLILRCRSFSKRS